MPSEPLDKKFEAFGWNVIKCDGHDFDALGKSMADARACTDKPSGVLLSTTKGKGVSFMENNAGWHGKAPDDEQYETAVKELKEHLASLGVMEG